MSAGSPRPPIVMNHCRLPAWVIGSLEFQRHPEPLEIDNLRTSDRRLFQKLDAIDDAAERGRVFHDYVSVKFRLHEWPQHHASARSSLRHTYVRFLNGWGADSNGHSGAVLKAWVESRFGLPARYHGGRLPDDDTAVAKYLTDRMQGAARTMGVFMQLDLMYTYCQYELERRHAGRSHLVLFRGTHDPEEYAVSPAPPGGSTTVVALNNLSSFTSDREVAWEFGSRVWQVDVPLPKIVFFSGLLPPHMLGGENEFLVLGGAYEVRQLRW